MKEDFINRLKKAFNATNYKELSVALDMKENTIKTWVNRDSYDIKQIVSKCNPDINLNWLLAGKGSMLKSEEKLAIPTNNPVGIPLIGLEVAAGFGNSDFAIHESDIQNRYLVPDFVDIDYMVRVKGDSMIPKYSAGDIIACRIIRESKFIQWNKCYTIGTTEQGLLVKRVKKGANDDSLLLVSENKDYDPFEIPISEITGMALVVGVIRME